MKKERLNDGYAKIYSVKKKKTDFNAEVAAKTIEDLKFELEMAYEEKSKRDQDYEFANSEGHALNLKLKMRAYEGLSKEYKVVIDSVMYNIFKIDHSKKERCMYLYLEEERKIAE